MPLQLCLPKLSNFNCNILRLTLNSRKDSILKCMYRFVLIFRFKYWSLILRIILGPWKSPSSQVIQTNTDYDLTYD